MAELKSIPPDELFRRCDEDAFSFGTTDQLDRLPEVIGQQRALDAVHFGINIRRHGYNLFVMGAPGYGKRTMVRQSLSSLVSEDPTPSDWVYLHNFDTPHAPRALRLPPERGRIFSRQMQVLVEELRRAIPAAFEGEQYKTRGEAIEGAFQQREKEAFEEINKEAQRFSVVLSRTPMGFVFAPTSNGKVMTQEAFAELPQEEQEKFKAVVGGLQEQLEAVLEKVAEWRKQKRSQLHELNKEITTFAVGHLIDELKIQCTDLPEVLEYLDAVRQDVIERVDEFRKSAEEPDGSSTAAAQGDAGDTLLRRYRVNVLVEHGEDGGAPIVYESNPTYQNLIGRVEHVSRLGTLVTDFTLIKPGALHKANGGYLLLDARKVLTQAYCWESLKRALSAGEIRIESLGEMLSVVSTVSLSPEPIPLDVKVILLGDRRLYYLLNALDPEFTELFKVPADIEDTIDRTPENDALYARFIATLADREELRPFERGAVSRIIEHSARMAEDAEKLSAHFRAIADIMTEADYWADNEGRSTVSRLDVTAAIKKQVSRVDRVRSHLLEQIQRGTLLIDTDGECVAQVNGLSVLDLGNFRFGRPMRITATARVGAGDMIDIEREVELGGAVHSKGVLILSQFLASTYAPDRPLSLTASLVFEQSYGMVDGDSASVAELCALLSALSNVPIRQCFAVTGSVNQVGQVQAIGGANEKIEGFFDVCSARGLTGRQGVIIPASNAVHLMLREDVVAAAKAGQFVVYPVATIDDAIALLTGTAAGTRGADGSYPEGSINCLVEARLKELSDIRARYVKGGKHDERA